MVLSLRRRRMRASIAHCTIACSTVDGSVSSCNCGGCGVDVAGKRIVILLFSEPLSAEEGREEEEENVFSEEVISERVVSVRTSGAFTASTRSFCRIEAADSPH